MVLKQYCDFPVGTGKTEVCWWCNAVGVENCIPKGEEEGTLSLGP